MFCCDLYFSFETWYAYKHVLVTCGVNSALFSMHFTFTYQADIVIVSYAYSRISELHYTDHLEIASTLSYILVVDNDTLHYHFPFLPPMNIHQDIFYSFYNFKINVFLMILFVFPSMNVIVAQEKRSLKRKGSPIIPTTETPKLFSSNFKVPKLKSSLRTG